MINEIEISDYDYELPPERIAQYPVTERDKSRLLVYRSGCLADDSFINIGDHIPENSLLIFNNTRVIRARLLFQKKTGAVIEILCLEPTEPAEYELSFSSTEYVEWKCIVGNLKKWKEGAITTSFYDSGKEYQLSALKLRPSGDAWIIKLSWNCSSLSFAEVIERAGHIPLPPYIGRDDTEEDASRYQTVYSTVDGSVAAPTAGLHFTDQVFQKIAGQGIKTSEITLHVGAGTFQPVKCERISGHEMHNEHFFVSSETIEAIIQNKGRIISVGTTSVRTLESLYWLGVKAFSNKNIGMDHLQLAQWEPYSMTTEVSLDESMEALMNLMSKNKVAKIEASTGIIIIPGYRFRVIDGIITNFHQPRSTLLLLISAWTGENWRTIYHYALNKGFRFLSYGDSSLLLR